MLRHFIFYMRVKRANENEKISGKNKMAALFSLFMRTKKRPRVRWPKKNAKNKMQRSQERASDSIKHWAKIASGLGKWAVDGGRRLEVENKSMKNAVEEKLMIYDLNFERVVWRASIQASHSPTSRAAISALFTSNSALLGLLNGKTRLIYRFFASVVLHTNFLALVF